MGCVVVQQATEMSKGPVAQCGCAVSVVCLQKIVANRTSLLIVYLPQPLYKAPELQVTLG